MPGRETNEVIVMPHRRLGRLPAKANRKALHAVDFMKKLDKPLPKETHFWPKRKPFEIRDYGNLDYGDCTRASQAHAITRMERLEQRRTLKIPDSEPIRVYKEMTTRRYGADWEQDPKAADTGAYEEDALNDWRNPATTILDSKGRPLKIDAFVRLNPFDHEQVKTALFSAGAHGIKVCLNLPAAWMSVEPPADWELPEGQQLVGSWMPGSWGGHSMYARDYDATGFWLVHTWNLPDQRITYRAAAVYMDEAFMVIDSINEWKKKKGLMRLELLREAVNDVSEVKIAA